MAKEDYKKYNLTAAQNRVFKDWQKLGTPFLVTHLDAIGDVHIEAKGKRLVLRQSGFIYEEGGPVGATQSETAPKEHKWKDVPYQPPLIKHIPEAKKDEPWAGYKPYTAAAPYVVDNKTICQSRTNWCQPREIKMVAFDADNTIWEMNAIATSVTGKLKKLDDNTVVELHDEKAPKQSKLPAIMGYDYGNYDLEEIKDDIISGLFAEKPENKVDFLEKTPVQTYKTVVKLKPTFRATLDELDKRGIPATVISLNTPGTVKRILEEFGLANRFVDIRDSWDNKGKVFAEQAQKLGIPECSALFLDDRKDHVEDVTKKCGLGLQIGAGKDVQQPIEILKFIKD